MIDLFSLGLTHILIALAAWRLLSRADLDAQGEGTGRAKRRAGRSGPARSPEPRDA